MNTTLTDALSDNNKDDNDNDKGKENQAKQPLNPSNGQSNNHTFNNPPAYKISKKPSKYADFMHAYKVCTPKYKFYVERGGEPSAPAIVLIMGLGAQFLVWPNEFCLALIDAGFQVIRFDNRDIGKSSKIKHKNELTKLHQSHLKRLHLLSQYKLGVNVLQYIPNAVPKRLPRFVHQALQQVNELHQLPVPYDLYDMAEDVNQLLNALQIERCHLLGMSMGGMIAQIFAANYAHRVISLGLLSTSNNRALLPPPTLKSLRLLTRTAPSRDDGSIDIDASINHTVELLKIIGSPDHFDEHWLREKTRQLHERRFYPKGTTRQLLAILATGSLTKLNTHIHQPTLIVHGKKDTLLPPAHAKALHKAIPNARLHLIDELGHDIPPALSVPLSELFVAHFLQHGDTVYS